MALFGYARVSTTEQETQLQLDALKRFGVRKIFSEKTSSVGNRPELRKALQAVGKNDLLVVYKLDRLARSLQDLLQIMSHLDSRGCGFKSLTEPIDTASPAGRLMMHMLGSVAEFERSLIRERSMAGQQAARERGVKCGRPRSIDSATEAAIVDLYSGGWYTMPLLADAFGVGVSSVKRAIYRVKKPEHSSLR